MGAANRPSGFPLTNGNQRRSRALSPMYALLGGEISPRRSSSRATGGSSPLHGLHTGAAKSSIPQARRLYSRRPYRLPDGGTPRSPRSPRSPRANRRRTAGSNTCGWTPCPTPCTSPRARDAADASGGADRCIGLELVVQDAALEGLQSAELGAIPEEAEGEVEAAEVRCSPRRLQPQPRPKPQPTVLGVLWSIAETSWRDLAREEEDDGEDEESSAAEDDGSPVSALRHAETLEIQETVWAPHTSAPNGVASHTADVSSGGDGDGGTAAMPAPAGSSGSSGPICSRKQLLWFSVVHQLSLLLLGLLAWAAGMAAGLGSHCRVCWLPLSTYVVVGLGLWGTHWAGHRRWVWPSWFDFFEAHTIGHHVKAYPPSKFLQDHYVSTVQRQKLKRRAALDRPGPGALPPPPPPRQAAAATFPGGALKWLGFEPDSLNTLVYLPWPLLSAGLHWAAFGLSAPEAGLCLLTALLVCLEQELIHRHVHVRGSPLERFRWFAAMRALHLLHHRDGMKHNYAMADFTFDILSGNLISTV